MLVHVFHVAQPRLNTELWFLKLFSQVLLISTQENSFLPLMFIWRVAQCVHKQKCIVAAPFHTKLSREIIRKYDSVYEGLIAWNTFFSHRGDIASLNKREKECWQVFAEKNMQRADIWFHGVETRALMDCKYWNKEVQMNECSWCETGGKCLRKYNVLLLRGLTFFLMCQAHNLSVNPGISCFFAFSYWQECLLCSTKAMSKNSNGPPKEYIYWVRWLISGCWVKYPL